MSRAVKIDQIDQLIHNLFPP